MHLSLLSDSYLSDSLRDAGRLPPEGSHGRAHRDGLLRGLLFVAALALPLALTIALTPADRPAAPAVTSLHVTHLRLS